MTAETEEFLSHYGVKGMKWGVRNAALKTMDRTGFTKAAQKNAANAHKRTAVGVAIGSTVGGGNRARRKAAKQEHKAWKKDATSSETANKVFQEAVKTSKPAFNRLNNSPAFKGKDLTKDYALAREYDRQVSQMFNDHMMAASLKNTLNKNQDRFMMFQFDRSLGMMRATEMKRLDDVQHSDDEADGFPNLRAVFNDLGHVVELIPVTEDDAFFEQMDDAADFLEHYGVKGMKWGKRKNVVREPHSEEAQSLAGVHTRAKTQKSTKMLSNKELQDAIKRMQLEQQFSQLSGNIDKTRSQKAKQFVSNMLFTSGKQGSQQLANEKAKAQFQKAFEFAAKKGAGL